MLCSRCERGLGIVTILIKGLCEFRTIVCPECQGVGSLCNRCGGNPAHCDCDKDDNPPLIRRQNPHEY